MKTSQKILVSVSGILVAFLIVVIIFTRLELSQVLDRKGLPEYETVLDERFDQLRFSSNWSVRLKQNREYKVEFSIQDSVYSPQVENKDGELWFSWDSTVMQKDQQLKVIVTAPFFKRIEGEENVTLELLDYSGDSLVISLGDGSQFLGWENVIYNTKFQLKGEVSIDIVDDPDM